MSFFTLRHIDVHDLISSFLERNSNMQSTPKYEIFAKNYPGFWVTFEKTNFG